MSLSTSIIITFFFLALKLLVLPFLSPSYIHPDEFFQTPYILPSRGGAFPGIFDRSGLRAVFTDPAPTYSTFVPWEFDPTRSHAQPSSLVNWGGPIRSILPMAITNPWLVLSPTAIPDFVSDPTLLFLFSRCITSFLTMSLLEGFVLHRFFKLLYRPPHCAAAYVSTFLSIYIFTFTSLVMGCRSFSNSVETILLSCFILALHPRREESIKNQFNSIVVSTEWPSSYPVLAGLLAAIGLFNRGTTFPIFAIYPTVCYCSRAIRLLFNRRQGRLSIINVASTVAAFAALSATFVVHDSYFYSSTGDSIFPLSVTPLNAVLYNVSPENQASHGLHPWWTHVIVNMLIVNGPVATCLFYWGLFEGLKNTYESTRRSFFGGKPSSGVPRVSVPVSQSHFDHSVLWQTLVGTVVVSLATLSVSRHQEPRFITPLSPIVSIIVLPILCNVAEVEKESQKVRKLASGTKAPAMTPHPRQVAAERERMRAEQARLNSDSDNDGGNSSQLPRKMNPGKRALLLFHCVTCLSISVFYGALSHSGLLLALNNLASAATHTNALFVGTLPPPPFFTRLNDKLLIDHVSGGRESADVLAKIQEICSAAGTCGATTEPECPAATRREVVLVHLSEALAKKFGAASWGMRRGGYWPHVDTDELGFDVAWEVGDSSRFTLAVFEVACDGSFT